jgi:hypothetical protein
MLVINQRMDKLAAARVRLSNDGHLDGPGLPARLLPQMDPTSTDSPATAPTQPGTTSARTRSDVQAIDHEMGPVDEPEGMADVKLAKSPGADCHTQSGWNVADTLLVPRRARDVYKIAQSTNQPSFPSLLRRFLYDTFNPDAGIPRHLIPLDLCPDVSQLRLYTFHSARAIYFAPSDLSGIGGMHRERIRSVKSWLGGAPRYDCVFIGKSEEPGFAGYHVARVFLFFSFKYANEKQARQCALIHWFSSVGTEPCPVTGLWVVRPDFRNECPVLDIVASTASFAVPTS